jgi:ribonucleoside-diphosphate reductase alpha chain
VNDNGKDLVLNYASPLFEQALELSGLDPETRQHVIDEVAECGTCQKVSAVPANVRNVFVVSQDISSEEHVRMQAAMQAFVDNSISKTINFSESATVDDVANAYMLAWELGCKGITAYVTGSREKVVLETKAVADKKKIAEASEERDQDEIWIQIKDKEQPEFWQIAKKPRPRFLVGYTFTVETPLGKAFVTINENGETQPFEVFINTAKAGSDTASVSEAIGRMVSYVLRIASPVEPVERMQEVIRQLTGIGGGRSLGFGPKRVRSLPDGVSQVLNEYLENRKERLEREQRAVPTVERKKEEEMPAQKDLPLLKIGDLCPECGQAAVINEEGCRKCYACGFSEC